MSKSAHKRNQHAKQRLRLLVSDRPKRIRLLIKRGIISDKKEIPVDAIPIDFDASTKAEIWLEQAYYEDIEFICSRCSKSDSWSAQSQQYYFEVMKSSPYKEPRLCYDCRQEEVERKDAARSASGHKAE